ncbi:hypothetical_protein [Leishmania braziliensis MHOM/BR/75/M2904]|uniref:Hypothetical_protein n=1 Tax=Leishmania braziliensis MHOM/BR/75/M2904 TaxID=420245 RepID=A0A3P3ZHG1_LEIBR|nr:unnamed protein product [Leishmania braziliensis]CAJ2481043.1 unnamed protein product [Leishmania braziliensis]SYZ69692.1 hypothetical_protein [Leishmania braziliensis MHOM/BR/75/M2904]
MSTASINESVHSMADSLDEEFLPTRAIHVKNVALCHGIRDAPRMRFQPSFVRINSMDYRGHGIVEDMDKTMPISALPSRLSPSSYPRKPVATNLLAEVENDTRQPHPAHTQREDKLLLGFSLDAGDSRAAYSHASA